MPRAVPTQSYTPPKETATSEMRWNKTGRRKLLIYDNIKRLCIEKGITISALEKACGISNGTIRKWADGISPIRVCNLLEIAKYFDVSVNEIISNASSS